MHGASPCDKLKNIKKTKDKITNKTYHNEHQCRKSYVNDNSSEKIYIASGIYPVDVRDELIYNNCVDDDLENVRNKNDNDIVVRAKINGCVGNVLFDAGAQISLISEKFINKHRHQLKKKTDLTCQQDSCHDSHRRCV